LAKLKNIRFQQSGWKTGVGYITTVKIKEELADAETERYIKQQQEEEEKE